MSDDHTHFKDVTLLITHYNRSNSLERLLLSFKQLNCSFEDIVVSDDGSKPEHLDYLKSLEQQLSFRLITTPTNKGLGNNINKGQDAVTTIYTLYVQEDFEPAQDFATHFNDGLSILKERKDIDVIRFYAYFKYPFLKPFKNGFSEMIFKIWYSGYNKFYYYSDHPHLRYSNFFQKFGRYTEGIKGDITEYRMMMSFLQRKGKAMFYEDFKGLFFQKNSQAEPSTMKRNFWRESHSPVVNILREAYRSVKFNMNYFLTKY
jgi:glycosyltransferase involved in cell wall biosynthesis